MGNINQRPEQKDVPGPKKDRAAKKTHTPRELLASSERALDRAQEVTEDPIPKLKKKIEVAYDKANFWPPIKWDMHPHRAFFESTVKAGFTKFVKLDQVMGWCYLQNPQTREQQAFMLLVPASAYKPKPPPEKAAPKVAPTADLPHTVLKEGAPTTFEYLKEKWAGRLEDLANDNAGIRELWQELKVQMNATPPTGTEEDVFAMENVTTEFITAITGKTEIKYADPDHKLLEVLEGKLEWLDWDANRKIRGVQEARKVSPNQNFGAISDGTPEARKAEVDDREVWSDDPSDLPPSTTRHGHR